MVSSYHGKIGLQWSYW